MGKKQDFYSDLNMDDITDAEYNHAKKILKIFRIKNLGEYHDFFVPSNTLWLADMFENFRNKFIEIYELDSAHLLSACSSGLAWQVC